MKIQKQLMFSMLIFINQLACPMEGSSSESENLSPRTWWLRKRPSIRSACVGVVEGGLYAATGIAFLTSISHLVGRAMQTHQAIVGLGVIFPVIIPLMPIDKLLGGDELTLYPDFSSAFVPSEKQKRIYKRARLIGGVTIFGLLLSYSMKK